jgi:dienelactone hydrolase
MAISIVKQKLLIPVYIRSTKQKEMKKQFAKILSMICMMTMMAHGSYAQVGEPPKSSAAAMKEEEFDYGTDEVKLKGFVAYIPNAKAKLPVVLIVPEWWGYNSYVKMRARKLAELGYFAMVVDMYGEGKEAKTVEEAQKWSGDFYKNPNLAKSRLEGAERKLRSYNQADINRVAAIGYCFGGSMVLNAVKMGMDFKGVVSFHGGLQGVPASKGKVKAKVLVCHGADDKFVSAEDVKAFRLNMDTAQVRYLFKVYPGATHAFTNPDATANGKKFNLPIAYNEAADKASWEDMRRFLRDVFYKK